MYPHCGAWKGNIHGMCAKCGRFPQMPLVMCECAEPNCRESRGYGKDLWCINRASQIAYAENRELGSPNRYVPDMFVCSECAKYARMNLDMQTESV